MLIITSLAAALLSATGMRALAYWLRGGETAADALPPPALLLGVLAIPLLLTTLGSVFVYRHTARRRKLQAALTALFALVLTSAALFVSRIFLKF